MSPFLVQSHLISFRFTRTHQVKAYTKCRSCCQVAINVAFKNGVYYITKAELQHNHAMSLSKNPTKKKEIRKAAEVAPKEMPERKLILKPLVDKVFAIGTRSRKGFAIIKSGLHQLLRDSEREGLKAGMAKNSSKAEGGAEDVAGGKGKGKGKSNERHALTAYYVSVL